MSRGRDEADDEGRTDSQRLDKWLWFARVAKTRTLSATLVGEGKVRVNGAKVDKPAHTLKVGDVVTVVMRQRVRTLKVAGFAERRGGAEAASCLFDDLSPPPVPQSQASAGDSAGATVARREPGAGRPTKRDRRAIERFKFRST